MVRSGEYFAPKKTEKEKEAHKKERLKEIAGNREKEDIEKKDRKIEDEKPTQEEKKKEPKKGLAEALNIDKLVEQFAKEINLDLKDSENDAVKELDDKSRDIKKSGSGGQEGANEQLTEEEKVSRR